MSRKIAAYMYVLTVSPSARDEFHEDKRAAMDRFGLDEDEQLIILTDDEGRIRAAILEADEHLAYALHITMTPTPPPPPPPPPPSHPE